MRRLNSLYISLEELASLLYPEDEFSDYNQKDVEQASILAKRKEKQRNKAISLTSGRNTRKIKQETTKRKKNTVCVAQKLT